jgi:transcriptional regulator of acetoin/glycerol metabolism
MGTRWSIARRAQYEARHPPVDRREQKRLAQARYRQRHADRLRKSRRVADILSRQTHWPGHIRELAALIRALVADKDYVRTLGRELNKR